MTKYPKLRCYANVEEMFHPLTPAQAYRNYLHNACIGSKLAEQDAKAVMQCFDMLAQTRPPEVAFQCTLASTGVSQPTIEKTVQTIEDAIRESLEQFNKEHRTDGTALPIRERRIKRHNELLTKLSAIQVNGQPALTEKELEKILVRMPEVLKKERMEWNFQAVASEDKDKTEAGLGLTVRF